MNKLSIILSFLFLACNGNKKNKNEIPPPIAGETKVIAIFTLPDSSKRLDIAMRVLTEAIKYDSLKKEKVIINDTVCGMPTMVPVKDSTGKVVKMKAGGDSLQQIWIRYNCDSVKFTGIEGISIDSLLRKSASLH